MIQIFTTGGTIDKVYFDANSEFEVGHSLLPELLSESNIHEGYRMHELMRKDSLEMDDADRDHLGVDPRRIHTIPWIVGPHKTLVRVPGYSGSWLSKEIDWRSHDERRVLLGGVAVGVSHRSGVSRSHRVH